VSEALGDALSRLVLESSGVLDAHWLGRGPSPAELIALRDALVAARAALLTCSIAERSEATQ
jgi:hypothetical protein